MYIYRHIDIHISIYGYIHVYVYIYIERESIISALFDLSALHALGHKNRTCPRLMGISQRNAHGMGAVFTKLFYAACLYLQGYHYIV